MEEVARVTRPAAGGKTAASLTAEEMAIDREARMTISREPGQDRRQVASVCPGS